MRSFGLNVFNCMFVARSHACWNWLCIGLDSNRLDFNLLHSRCVLQTDLNLPPTVQQSLCFHHSPWASPGQDRVMMEARRSPGTWWRFSLYVRVNSGTGVNWLIARAPHSPWTPDCRRMVSTASESERSTLWESVTRGPKLPSSGWSWIQVRNVLLWGNSCCPITPVSKQSCPGGSRTEFIDQKVVGSIYSIVWSEKGLRRNRTRNFLLSGDQLSPPIQMLLLFHFYFFVSVWLFCSDRVFYREAAGWDVGSVRERHDKRGT